MDTTDLPAITADDDWLDLRVGERGLLRGRLHGALEVGDDMLVVANTSWEMLAVRLRNGYEGDGMEAGTAVAIVVERTEDGIEAESGDIIERPE